MTRARVRAFRLSTSSTCPIGKAIANSSLSVTCAVATAAKVALSNSAGCSNPVTTFLHVVIAFAFAITRAHTVFVTTRGAGKRGAVSATVAWFTCARC